MMQRMILVAVLAAGFVAQAQVSVTEAQAKLAEKDAQRKAERSKVVQISAGELADLKAELAQLKSELASLRGAKATASKPAPKKVYSEIEIGMTRDEVMAFIQQRKNSLRVVSVAANANVSRSTPQATVRRGGAVTRDDGAHQDTVAAAGKQETIKIERFGSVREQTGTQRNIVGGDTPVYEYVERTDGYVVVTLTDGIVSGVVAR